MAQAPMIRALDEAPLTPRFWFLAGAVMLGAVLDLFDFFLIAFVVPVISDEWDLTFGEAAAVLLSAGVGAIFGSIAWGRAGDRYGRRRVVRRATFLLVHAATDRAARLRTLDGVRCGVALIAGTGDLIEPDAALDALKPAFLFLAGFSLIVGLAFTFVKLEPHGKDLEALSAELVEQAAVKT